MEQIFKYNKKFLIIANKNSVTYKEIFPKIKENKMWTGTRSWGGGMWMQTFDLNDVDKVVDGINMKNVPSCWYTNLDHGKRHQLLNLMTMAENKKFNKKIQKSETAYEEYDNYNAIEIPFTDAIPSDYEGVMGVPISFLDKYNPDQFEILDINPHFFSIVEKGLPKPSQLKFKGFGAKDPYARILIKHKKKK